jgi:glycosyltransferase involved in cell wall biosynthesis
MKITFVMGGLSLAGGDRVIATYAKKLQERGHEVSVVSRPSKIPTLRDQVRSVLAGKGLIPARKPPSHFDNIGVTCKLLERFRPVQDEDVSDADVVIATWWETAHWVAKFSPAKGAKIHFIQHHEVFDYLPQAEAVSTYSLPLQKIVVARWLQDLMRERYGNSSVSLVPNSVDSRQFYAPPRHKQSVPTVGMIYSTTPWKRSDLVLEAFKIAASKVPQLRLLAFGESELPAKRIPPAKVTFTYKPTQDELRDHYAGCDAWLFGSCTEGFGLPILEAMACRTPVIGTPAGAAPELLADGAGLLVPHNSPEAMAEAIIAVCQMSDAEWQLLSNAAYQKSVDYTWEDATDRFEAALNHSMKHQTVPNRTSQPKSSQAESLLH